MSRDADSALKEKTAVQQAKRPPFFFIDIL
jgi:hypothetical protein